VIDLSAVGPALAAFVVILPAELPDKTFVATLVLATRFRPLAVWCGVTAAFAVQCLIAVTAGGLLSLLPTVWVLGVASALFAIGAVVMIRGGLRSRAEEQALEAEEARETGERITDAPAATSTRRAVLISFGVLFAAEWGDLSQLLTAGLAARYQAPLAVFAGSFAALALVAGLAVLAGRWLQERVPLARIRLIAGGILSVLAVVTAVEAFGAL
jgi:putative Ca2+/H+ antiporter (TMEM165/GDT1 family)